MKSSVLCPLFAALCLLLSGCLRDNGTATHDPITDAQYQEASTNEQARTR